MLFKTNKDRSRIDALDLPYPGHTRQYLWPLGSRLRLATWLTPPQDHESTVPSVLLVSNKEGPRWKLYVHSKNVYWSPAVCQTLLGTGDPAVNRQYPWPHGIYIEIKQFNKPTRSFPMVMKDETSCFQTDVLESLPPDNAGCDVQGHQGWFYCAYLCTHKTWGLSFWLVRHQGLHVLWKTEFTDCGRALENSVSLLLGSC